MASPKMTLQTLGVLSVMLDDPYKEWYGLELCASADLKSGTLYPILARLEAATWMASSWEEVDPAVVGRPRRRLYRLTGDGADTARRVVDEALQKMDRRRVGKKRLKLKPGESAI